jgi:hypothetical protein
MLFREEQEDRPEASTALDLGVVLEEIIRRLAHKGTDRVDDGGRIEVGVRIVKFLHRRIVQSKSN